MHPSLLDIGIIGPCFGVMLKSGVPARFGFAAILVQLTLGSISAFGVAH